MNECEGDTNDNLSLAWYVGPEETRVRPRFLRHRGNANPPFTHSPPIPLWVVNALRDPSITPLEQVELVNAMAPDVARWADELAPGLWSNLGEIVKAR